MELNAVHIPLGKTPSSGDPASGKTGKVVGKSGTRLEIMVGEKVYRVEVKNPGKVQIGDFVQVVFGSGDAKEAGQPVLPSIQAKLLDVFSAALPFEVSRGVEQILESFPEKQRIQLLRTVSDFLEISRKIVEQDRKEQPVEVANRAKNVVDLMNPSLPYQRRLFELSLRVQLMGKGWMKLPEEVKEQLVQKAVFFDLKQFRARGEVPQALPKETSAFPRNPVPLSAPQSEPAVEKPVVLSGQQMQAMVGKPIPFAAAFDFSLQEPALLQNPRAPDLGKFELPMYPERNAPAPFRGSPQPMRNVAQGEAANPEPHSHTPIPRGEQKPLLAREVQQFFPPARGETPPEQILFRTAKQQLEPLPGGAPSTTPDFPADQRVDPSAPGPSTTPPQPDDSRIPLRSFPLLENRLKSLLSFSPLLKKALQIPEGVGEKPATAISWQKWVQQLLERSDISPKNRESLLLFQAFLKQASLSETLSPLSLEKERPVSVEKENALQQWTSLGLEEKGAHKLFENLVQFVQKSMEEPAVSPFLFRESLPGFLGQVAKELQPLSGNPEAQEALPQNVSRLLVSLSRVATRLFLLLQDLRLRQSFSEAPTPSTQQSQSAASADAAKAEPASARPEPAPSPPAEGTGKTPPASISPAPSNSLEPQTQATPATPKTGQPPVGDVESKRSIPPQTEAKPLPAQAEERRAGTSAKPSGVSFSPQGEANEKLPPMLSRVMNHFSSAYSPHFYSGLLELEANPFWIDVHRDASESGEGPYQKKELFKIWVETPTMNFGQVQVEVVAREHRLDLQLFVQPEYSHAFSGTAPVLFQRLRDEGFSLQRFLIRNRKPNDELLQEKAKVLLPVKRGFEARG